jgi:thymidine kinase
MQGKLRFCYGTMESAKSALLLIEAYNFEKRGIGFLCMKPSVDNRESINYISSRIGIERECLTIYPDFDIYTVIYKMVSERKEDEPVLQWILVDESQFLTTIQVEELRRIVDDFGINVLCYGLRTDFMTNLFDGSKRLFELADDLNEMKISCSCGRKAIINARFNENNEIVINGEQVLIGGEDIYKPLCSKCYTEEVKKVLQYI